MRLLTFLIFCFSVWSTTISELQRHIPVGPLIEPGGSPSGKLAWQGLYLVLVLGFHLPEQLAFKESMCLKSQHDGNPTFGAQRPQPATHSAMPSLSTFHRLRGVWGTMSILLALTPFACFLCHLWHLHLPLKSKGWIIPAP